ncbi:hypothetical protein [Xenorhabdus bovienii]|nr:hypothetical protein [Xenorhabdus bovienii]
MDEKTFLDILVHVSEKYDFAYDENKMLELANDEIYKSVLEQAENSKKYLHNLIYRFEVWHDVSCVTGCRFRL